MEGEDRLTVSVGTDIDGFLDGISRVKAEFASLGDSVRQQTQDHDRAASEQIRIITAFSKAKDDAIQNDYRSGKITLQQEVDDLVAAENDKWSALRGQYAARRTLYQDDAAAAGQVNAAVEIAWLQHQQRLVQIQQQAAQQMRRQSEQLQRQWEAALRPVENSFITVVNGMIGGTESFRQAMLKMGRSIVLDMVDDVIRRIVKEWIAGELAKTEATAAETAARTGMQATAAEAGAAAEGAAQKQSILGHAASGAAAVYDDVAQIPYVGWLLAPPAAAAAFAAILAFGGDIPSFDTGAWNIPSDTLAMVHQGETILPAGLAAAFRSAATGGGGGDSYAITIQAIDTQTGAQFLKNNIGVIVAGLTQQKRNLNAAFAS